jgi:beta-D-xylosidase 4
MAAHRGHLLALLWASGVYAVFPDCVNGPLKNNTICNVSASKLSMAMFHVHRSFS